MLSKQNILTLLNIPFVGKKTVSKINSDLKGTFKNANDYLDYFLQKLKAKRLKSLNESDIKRAEAEARKIIKHSKSHGIKILGLNDKNFPRRLKTIPDAPVLIFVKGNLKILDSEIAIGVVGTRKPSEYGKKMASKIGKVLAEKKITLISGLALGCDAESQLGCVDNKGITVAVLAHGLDIIAPKANSFLAEKILSSKGCWVSEYPVGTEIRANNFVERNRIQSGLSDAIIVIETGKSGGTMKTVQFSQKQNRPIFCIEPPTGSKKLNIATGNTLLIKKGSAQGITDQDDIEHIIKYLQVSSSKYDDFAPVPKGNAQMTLDFKQN